MKKKLFFLFILLVVFSFSLYSLFRIPNNLVDYREIPFYVGVGDHLGFNVNSSALYFGTLQRGAYGFRNFVVKNEECGICDVEIRVNSLEEWIYLSDNSFRLKKGEFREITAYAFVPAGAEKGEYNGTLSILFWKSI